MNLNNGDRRMGDYENDKPIGKYAILHANYDITSIFYN